MKSRRLKFFNGIFAMSLSACSAAQAVIAPEGSVCAGGVEVTSRVSPERDVTVLDQEINNPAIEIPFNGEDYRMARTQYSSSGEVDELFGQFIPGKHYPMRDGSTYTSYRLSEKPIGTLGGGNTIFQESASKKVNAKHLRELCYDGNGKYFLFEMPRVRYAIDKRFRK
jgi:hypothetical protein